MKLPKILNSKKTNILKIAGLSLLALIVLAGLLRFVGLSFNSVFKASQFNIPHPVSISYDYDDYKYEKASSAGLSIRNAEMATSSAPIYEEGAMGDDAEEFEVTEYTATIETRHLEEACPVITNLKAKEYVVFESANEYDSGCNYTFKVKKDNVAEILDIVKGMNPKELSESTYTIKKLVDDFTSEIEILEKKLSSIDVTLTKAVSAYDSVTALAVSVQDVESLAKIIDSKINLIERLTQERIDINSQLERIERSKAEQLDRLEYTYFYVNIFENKFVDGSALKDSWKLTIKEFVYNTNQFVQDITVNLVVFLFILLQYIVYLLILLFVAKYGWQFIKYIWKK
jgi:hypothetical protein